MIATIILIVIAYILGSLSSAIIVCQLFKLPDPRTQGSNNPGTNNVLRIGGKLPAAITLLGDMLKGFIPVLIGHLLGLSGLSLGLIALAALAGHIYPMFFKFDGGKGVATALGCYLAISPLLGLLALVTWAILVLAFRYASLASMGSVLLAPLYAFFVADTSCVIPLIIIAIVVVWKHIDNIKRLYTRTENKLTL